MAQEKTLKDIMTTDLKVVRLNTTFEKVKAIFDKNTFHHIPVIDEMAMVKGMISKHDFTKIAYRISKESAGETSLQNQYNSIIAKKIMTPNPVFLNPEDSISLAADLFLENVYHAIPIVEDGVLMGIITTHDLLAFAYYREPVGKNRLKL